MLEETLYLFEKNLKKSVKTGTVLKLKLLQKF